MHGKEKAFTFFLTGREDNDTAAENYVRNHGYDGAKCVQYKLEYTPPYEKFTGIADFERITQYRPFCDPIQKKAAAIIDLSEWIGHEKDQYLEIFYKFLHDYDWSFYKYEYVFTAGKADRSQIKEVYTLAEQYLCEGGIEEDRTMTSEKEMTKYLSSRFPVDRALAEKLSTIFISGQIKGYPQLNTVMEDFIRRMQWREGKVLSEKQAGKMLARLKGSKMDNLFGKSVMEWREEYMEEMDKEEAV